MCCSCLLEYLRAIWSFLVNFPRRCCSEGEKKNLLVDDGRKINQRTAYTEGNKALPAENSGIAQPQSIQVLIPNPSNFLTDKFFNSFDQKLQTMGLKTTLIDVYKFNADESCTDVVLVICHETTRLESDIESTVRLLQKKDELGNVKENYSRIFLILVHADRHYPFSSKDKIKKKGFNNIVDIDFSTNISNYGFADCTNNTFAFESICNISKQF